MIHKYHKEHSYFDNNTQIKVNFTSQLYVNCIYGIINNDSTMQLTFKDYQIVRLEKALVKEQEKGNIKDLVFTNPIRVINTPEGYKEFKNDRNTN